MKKNYSKILLPFLSLCLILMISNKGYSTNVTGGIYSSTTWTVANSPYIISDTLVIFQGVTLTIQPGVVVEFNASALIDDRGDLYANGTPADSIIFTSSSATPTAGIYQGINIGSDTVSFSYCRFSYAITAINVTEGSDYSPPVTHCLFTSDLTGINGLSAASIDTCTFKYDSIGIQADLGPQQFIIGCQFIQNSDGIYFLSCPLLNCTFSNNNYGVYEGGNAFAQIAYCTFDSNRTCGLSIGGDTIENCSIKYNGVGIISEDNIIILNDISDNGIGIQSTYDQEISCNSICNNTDYNIVDEDVGNQTASDNYWCLTDSASIQATIDDGHKNLNLGLVSFMPFDTVACANTGTVFLVWPGDANEDLVVNNFDLLPIGLYYGDSGIARSSVSNTWAPQSATDWDSIQADGYNRKFVDCNGDGIINSDDTLAVTLNYGLTHPLDAPRSSPERTAGTIPFSIVTDSSSYHAGSTVHATVLLGNSTNPATNIYGLAYDISLNTSTIEPGSIVFNYNNSSLFGAKNADALVITKLNNDVETAVTGIDHINKSGYGDIADLYFTLTNSSSSSQLELLINPYEAVDAQGNQIGLVVANLTGVNQLSINNNQLSVYPNPTNGEIAVNINSSVADVKGWYLQVTDVLGRTVYTRQSLNYSNDIDLSNLPSGVYFITVINNTSRVVVPLVKQ